MKEGQELKLVTDYSFKVAPAKTNGHTVQGGWGGSGGGGGGRTQHDVYILFILVFCLGTPLE